MELTATVGLVTGAFLVWLGYQIGKAIYKQVETMTKNQRSLSGLLDEYSQLTPAERKAEDGKALYALIKIANNLVLKEYDKQPTKTGTITTSKVRGANQSGARRGTGKGSNKANSTGNRRTEKSKV